MLVGVVVTVVFDRFRRGTVVMAAAVMLGRVLAGNAARPNGPACLAVRRRSVDVVCLGSLGLGLLVVALVVPAPELRRPTCRMQGAAASTHTSTPCPSGSRTSPSEVRDLIHSADPEIEETIKYRGRPYFVLDGNVAALMGTKDHVNVFLYDPIVDDPDGIITHGHGNATGRQIAIYQGDPLNTQAFVDDDQADRGPQSRRRLAAAHPTRLVRHRHCD